jgi:hypothetical protein
MSVPSERIWIVETYFVDPSDGQYKHDPHALPNALLELVGTLTRIGGVVQVATRRVEIAQGRTETVAVVFRWRSFVPVDKAQVAPDRERDGTAEQAAAPPLDQPSELPGDDEPVTPEAVAETLPPAQQA